MKAVPVSISLFILLIICVALNSVTIRNAESKIIEYAEVLRQKGDRAEIIDELEDYWEKNRKFIGLSIPHSQLDKTTDTIILLRHANTSHDEEEFLKHLDLLEECAKSIGRMERKCNHAFLL